MNRQWMIEIPSVEHPTLLASALDEATQRGIKLDRVSMGSGLQYLSAREVVDMRTLADDHQIDIYVYTSSRNSFEPSPHPDAGEQLIGEEAFSHATAELRMAADLGFAGVIVADMGLLALAGELREAGELGSLAIKSAAAIAPRNAAAARLYERLGATSINVAASSTRHELLAIREQLTEHTTVDIYVEAPADMGGGVRYRDAVWFVDNIAPVYLKVGIRNAQPLYPYGMHLSAMAEQTMREKVRRASIMVENLQRFGTGALAV